MVEGEDIRPEPMDHLWSIGGFGRQQQEANAGDARHNEHCQGKCSDLASSPQHERADEKQQIEREISEDEFL